jgi:hypothetical protein
MNSLNNKSYIINAACLGLIVIMFSACSNGSKPKKEISISAQESCLIGKWHGKDMDDSKVLTFVFNDDKTGYEDIGKGQRDFTWSFKDNKPIIVYKNETTEWPLSLNCEKLELVIFTLFYTKDKQ